MDNLGEHSGGVRAATTRVACTASDSTSTPTRTRAPKLTPTWPPAHRTRTLVVTAREDLAVLAEVKRLLVGS